MADVLQFESARHPFHRMLMRSVGFDIPSEWRIEGEPCQPFCVPPLRAAPRLVASRLNGDVRIIHMLAGKMPPELTEQMRFRIVLDAAVVATALSRRQRTVSRVVSWLIYDDKWRLEIRTSSTELDHAFQSGVRYVVGLGMRNATTEWVSDRMQQVRALC